MSGPASISAIVLAAGYSSRMGRFKPLLPMGSSTVLERAAGVFVAAGVGDVRVVTGHNAAALRGALERIPAREVFNPAYAAGMFASVLAGVDSLPRDAAACFVLPGDIPEVRPETILRMIREFRNGGAAVVYPVCEGRRGHPPLLSRRVLDAVRGGDAGGGLRGVLERFESEAATVEVDDPGIHLDVDTPADYEALRGRAEDVIGETESVCPVCLRRLPARQVAIGGNVYLAKSCPEHGSFRAVIWRGLPDYREWAGSRGAGRGAADPGAGCPFECGACGAHPQATCCAVLEVTQRCNLSCPFCFAAAGPDTVPDPPFAALAERCRVLLAEAGPVNLQLSGGEPTLRSDLPEVVALARELGFGFLQINTNGLRLAAEPGCARVLRRAGAGCVFLQFDGLSDDVYRRIRGRALLEVKLAAIRRCRDERLGVVLVPTLVPGVNTGQIGDILRFALDNRPAVRAVHFQPVSYFGRYPQAPSDSSRITIPEVLREIERQSGGAVRASDFRAPSAENSHCSFQGRFTVRPEGTLEPRSNQAGGCCGLVQLGAGEASRRSQRYVARQWSYPEEKAAGDDPTAGTGSFDAFLALQQDAFSISGMAFQDAWNLDLNRLRDCFLHAVDLRGRLVPLCSYNLTRADGKPLHRAGGVR